MFFLCVFVFMFILFYFSCNHGLTSDKEVLFCRGLLAGLSLSIGTTRNSEVWMNVCDKHICYLKIIVK